MGLIDKHVHSFLLNCLQRTPSNRASADELLKNYWIVTMEAEREEMLRDEKQVCLNLAEKIRENMDALKQSNPLEWCLFRALENEELIEEELEVVESYFKAIDIYGDQNGKISFGELIEVLMQTGIFIDSKSENITGTPKPDGKTTSV